MIESIEIIDNLESLKGTCYLEIKPGKFTGEHWNEGSIFFTDETFTYFSNVIEKHCSKYSLWGMCEIDRETWKLIVEGLEDIKLFLMANPNPYELTNYIGFLYPDTTEKYFKENFTQNLNGLIQVITEFQTWITAKIKKYECISILGI